MENRPENIEKESQVLEGIGASAWFYISEEEGQYRITRYSESGDKECSRIFITEMDDFDIRSKYQFTYISNCQECRILQNNKIYVFKTIEYGY